MQVNEVNVKMHLEQLQDGKVLQRGTYSLMILYDMSVNQNRVCGNKILLSGQCKVTVGVEKAKTLCHVRNTTVEGNAIVA